MVCTVDLMLVSNQKPWVSKSESKSWKSSQVEVDLDSELGEDRQKPEGSQSTTSALMWILETLEDWNELQREQNEYLKRIREALEGGDIITREPIDSTLKE